MKLYPPILEGAIPAFTENTLIVPFTMNKSVSPDEVLGFELKLKTVQSGTQPLGGPVMVYAEKWNQDTNEVEFNLTNINKLNIGQFYKVQMAYVDDSGVVGHYSTVGVTKYTAEPEVNILEPKTGNLYEGLYSHGKDATEKVYSYSFTLTDSNGNVLEASGEKLHDSSNDVNLFESHD